MTEEETIPLEEIGKIETVKVYNQAYVDKQQKRIAELEKKNKELNTFISAYRNERDKIFDAWHTQLAEAKEIIKELLFTSNELDENTKSKAEQFLKELGK